jgi:hypothetical protein
VFSFMQAGSLVEYAAIMETGQNDVQMVYEVKLRLGLSCLRPTFVTTRMRPARVISVNDDHDAKAMGQSGWKSQRECGALFRGGEGPYLITEGTRDH